MKSLPWGFRILGPTTETRRLVNATVAFRGYADLDPRADVAREAYLSAFSFGEDFKKLLDETGSCKGFKNACWSPWLWFDIDRADDLRCAMTDAGRLAAGLVERYRLDEGALLYFFSGSKGAHIGLPTAIFEPEPSLDFHRGCRQLAESLSKAFGVNIDVGVYDRVRAFRAPNSRHPKTGLHKRRLSFDELLGLSVEAVLHLAEEPAAFELPPLPEQNDQATADWQAAIAEVKAEAESKVQRQVAVSNGMPTLNRQSLNFIRDGAGEGDRHRLLFSAAANLGEFGCPPALAHALLTDAALDSGLSPSEVRRQIECGLGHRGEATPATKNSSSIAVIQNPSLLSPIQQPGLRDELAKLWRKAPALGLVNTVEDTSPAADRAPDVIETNPIPPDHSSPMPPPGKTLYCSDAMGRPCSPSAAVRWTYEGATTWFDASTLPVPRPTAFRTGENG
jgi:hypothetical protein